MSAPQRSHRPHRRPRRPRQPGPRRTLAGLVAGALTTGLVAGCGVLPALPPDVPTDIVPTTAPTLDAQGSDVLSPDGFDAVQRMAVRIRNVGCSSLSTGSGFALDAHTLVTNKHVVADSSSLQVSTYDGHDIAAETASTANLADLAVVRTAEELPASPDLADADPVAGDPVTVVGYPEGGRLTITQGTVIGTTTDPLNSTLGEVLVTDAPVEPGSSGSAALDADGRVIGVVYAKTSTDKSLLVPLSTLRTMLDDDSAFTPVPGCAGPPAEGAASAPTDAPTDTPADTPTDAATAVPTS